jgi:hypothetical protein
VLPRACRQRQSSPAHASCPAQELSC